MIHALLTALSLVAADPKPVFKSPQEIIALMEASPLSYAIGYAQDAKFSFSTFTEGEPLADPAWYARKEKDGWTVDALKEPACSETLSAPAMEAMAARKYDESVRLYKAAYACDPRYVKNLTYIGNVFFYLGRMDSAETYLRRALAANPLDYQAHFFLADVHDHLGRPDSVRSELIHALLLNRHNPTVKSFARSFFAGHGSTLRDDPFVLGFRVARRDDKVSIDLGEMKHAPAATCLAVWQHDSAMAPARQADDPLHRNLLRNVLGNQCVYGLGKAKDRDTLDAATRTLVSVAEDGLLPTMILWEQASRLSPAVVYSLPPEERDRIRTYIGKYLIVKN